MFIKDCTMGDEVNRENSKMLRKLSSPNYGSVATIDNTSSDSGYTELLLGGVPCPTCRGLGHVPKEQEGQLIALIPLSDKRLKPHRTYLYVGLAVFLCLATAGLLVFFIFPRDVQLKSQRPNLHPSQVYVNVSESFVSFFITQVGEQTGLSFCKYFQLVLEMLQNKNYFTLINENYFPVLVTGVEMSVQYDTQVINSTRNQSVLRIPLREEKKYYIQIQITFNKVNQLGYIAGSCLSPIRWVHEIVMFFQLTASYTFLGHVEQTTITTFQFVGCYGGNETSLSRT